MKLLIEEYQYDVADVADVLDGLFTLQDVEQRVSVSYVGYYFNPNPKVRDVVFILPKVLIDEQGKVFGKYDPRDIIHIDADVSASAMSVGTHGPCVRPTENERKFLYEFAVWVHRAIVVFNEHNDKNGIVLHRQIQDENKGNRKQRSNTLLDVILSLLRFNKENKQFFTFILKNLHSGFNKINWGRTIARTTALVEDGNPTYLHPVNKKRQVNFDEELIIIFFSILQYVSDTYGFRSDINFGFKLITGAKFKRYLDGYGRIRLRQIKYKYFSDTAVRLWDLCYAFFDKTYRIRHSEVQKEYLLVKSFHVVFEAMIDELIGDSDTPRGLKEQEDGKRVDHFYTYDGLMVNRGRTDGPCGRTDGPCGRTDGPCGRTHGPCGRTDEPCGRTHEPCGRTHGPCVPTSGPDDDIYYIGDSKYYKMGNSLGSVSVYKQRTYARNVIQWNLDIWLNGKPNPDDRFERIRLFDEVTEGYNVIPNFFISASIDKERLDYEDRTEPHEPQPTVSRQFMNRLYDRDTLLLSHYDVNFLFVLALYARDKVPAKRAWRESVRAKFRTAVQRMLAEKFEFFAMRAKAGVDGERWMMEHFQSVLGKTMRPYERGDIFSLALDKEARFAGENERLLAMLGEAYDIVPVSLGENPSERLPELPHVERGAMPNEKGTFLFGIVRKLERKKEGMQITTKEYEAFANHEATGYVMKNMPAGDISTVKYFVPMYDGGIEGYYEITAIKFGSRKEVVMSPDGMPYLDSDGNEVKIDKPCLNLALGTYHQLGDHISPVGMFRKWNGQIHPFSVIMNLYSTNQS